MSAARAAWGASAPVRSSEGGYTRRGPRKPARESAPPALIRFPKLCADKNVDFFLGGFFAVLWRVFFSLLSRWGAHCVYGLMAEWLVGESADPGSQVRIPPRTPPSPGIEDPLPRSFYSAPRLGSYGTRRPPSPALRLQYISWGALVLLANSGRGCLQIWVRSRIQTQHKPPPGHRILNGCPHFCPHRVWGPLFQNAVPKSMRGAI